MSKASDLLQLVESVNEKAEADIENLQKNVLGKAKKDLMAKLSMDFKVGSKTLKDVEAAFMNLEKVLKMAAKEAGK